MLRNGGHQVLHNYDKEGYKFFLGWILQIIKDSNVTSLNPSDRRAADDMKTQSIVFGHHPPSPNHIFTVSTKAGPSSFAAHLCPKQKFIIKRDKLFT
ncbi:hypothetical protein TNCV_2816131 [Trichonephila clavipes]|nr:hypothetical protein TNCV_2816131 [Trichonephila clavipes]